MKMMYFQVIMSVRISVSQLIRCHASLKNFHYQVAIDWAVDLIRKGTETESVLILASLTDKEDSYTLSKYLSASLRELGLTEYGPADAVNIQIQFHIGEMLDGVEVYKNLRAVCELCYDLGYRNDLTPFYLLRYAWDDLNEQGQTHYYGTTKTRIDEDIRKEAGLWLQHHAVPV